MAENPTDGWRPAKLISPSEEIPPALVKPLNLLGKFGIPTRASWQFLRFNAAGLINGPFFLVAYELFYFLNLHPPFQDLLAHHLDLGPVPPRAATSWALAYIVGSIEAHFVHYKFTFTSKRSYFPSLWRTLAIYTTALILSTYTDYRMIADFELHHRLAWFINASFFGIFNFMALRFFAFMDVDPHTADPSPDAPS